MISRKEIVETIESILPEIIELRQNIHRNPELAGNEHATSALIRNILSFTELELLPPFLETDVVAMLNGNAPGRNVTLRADMDALPLNELNDLPYKSQIPGLMHACGHDGHTAILVGTVLVLNSFKDELKGSVRFVFQPGEEIAALGKALVESGALENPAPAAIVALHAISGYPVGSIITRSGTIMAAAGFFKIKVIGRGGHGSKPELTIDPILAGCRIVESLQDIVSRNIDPQEAVVISVCRFSGGANANVIPEEVELEGTVRFLNSAIGDRLPELIERTVEGICHAAGATYEFSYNLPYIPTVNDSDCVVLSRKVTEKYLGNNLWFELPRASMGAEDFSYYLRAYPGVFCNLGIGGDCPAIHNPKFNFNDEAIRNGILFFTGMVLEMLESEK